MTTNTHIYTQELQDILDSHEVQLIQFAKRVKREVVQQFCNKYKVRFVVSDTGHIRFMLPHTPMPDSFYTELNAVDDLLCTSVYGDNCLGTYVGNVEPVK